MAAVTKPKRFRIFHSEAARKEAIAGYMFLAPYLIVTAVFTVGVVAFAIYISFTDFNLFTAPEWNNFDHFKSLLSDKKFGRSLVNVFYYVIIVVTVQTTLALLLAVVLNAPIRFKQFYRTLFYAPSVTSAVVISFIFWWLYLKTGYINFAISKIWALFGAEWVAIEWLNDPRGLFQLIVEGVSNGAITIPSSQWYLRGPSITWMAIMAQNIFTTIPTFMIMFLAASTRYSTFIVRSSFHRWRQQATADVLPHHGADAAPGDFPGGRVGHYRYLANLRPGGHLNGRWSPRYHDYPGVLHLHRGVGASMARHAWGWLPHGQLSLASNHPDIHLRAKTVD